MSWLGLRTAITVEGAQKFHDELAAKDYRYKKPGFNEADGVTKFSRDWGIIVEYLVSPSSVYRSLSFVPRSVWGLS